MSEITLMDRQVAAASWLRLALAIAFLMSFSYWVFGLESPWTRALAAAGELPEMLPGFPALEPERTVVRLGAANADWLQWQALDVLFAGLNAAVHWAAISLGIKALEARARGTGPQRSPWRALLLLPVAYVGAELVENGLLAAFAAGASPPNGTPALIQQFATTLKFGFVLLAAVASAAMVLVAIIAPRRRI